jgi:aryl-alcohol dehydrogenase-like predicted oxidoreductase
MDAAPSSQPRGRNFRRRGFLKTAALSAAALAFPAVINAKANTPRLPRRSFGPAKGVNLSIIGMGGIVVRSTDQAHANRLVAEFVERGGNYFDVAPSYGDAELKLAPALKPYRKESFLACKTTERTREGAERELRQSLERFETDYFDLYQLHAITEVAKDVDAVFAKGGAMEAFIEAKKQGQIRYLGFSAHSVEAALAAMDRYDFDSVLFPVNFTTFYEGRFGPQIMEKAQAKGVARLALKSLARQKWPPEMGADSPERKKFPNCWYQPCSDPHEARLALGFTLSQPVTSALPPGDETLFRMAMDLAMDFAPITAAETAELEALAASLDPLFRGP